MAEGFCWKHGLYRVRCFECEWQSGSYHKFNLPPPGAFPCCGRPGDPRPKGFFSWPKEAGGKA